MSSTPERPRRRLDTKKDPGPRGGCLLTGAILGIIVGLTFAFYGLPPILRSIYGETTVAYGETYNEDARQMTVLRSERVEDEFEVEMRIRSNRTWDVDYDHWSLEISGHDDWIEALPPDPARPETGMDFPLGEERILLLRFPAPADAAAEPLELHLTDPRLGFELQPGEDE